MQLSKNGWKGSENGLLSVTNLMHHPLPNQTLRLLQRLVEPLSNLRHNFRVVQKSNFSQNNNTKSCSHCQLFFNKKKSDDFCHRKWILKVNFSHILTEARLASVVASEASLAPFCSELIVCQSLLFQGSFKNYVNQL